MLLPVSPEWRQSLIESSIAHDKNLERIAADEAKRLQDEANRQRALTLVDKLSDLAVRRCVIRRNDMYNTRFGTLRTSYWGVIERPEPDMRIEARIRSAWPRPKRLTLKRQGDTNPKPTAIWIDYRPVNPLNGTISILRETAMSVTPAANTQCGFEIELIEPVELEPGSTVYDLCSTYPDKPSWERAEELVSRLSEIDYYFLTAPGLP